MSLQIKRGNGAPSTLLKAGEQYLDTTTGYLYIGDGTENKIYVDKTEVETLIAAASAPSEPDIKVAAGTIPAIDPDTRVVVQVDLGVLRNKTSALINFFDSDSVSDEKIKAVYIPSAIHPASSSNNYPFYSINLSTLQISKTSSSQVSSLKVFEDYNLCMRDVISGNLDQEGNDGYNNYRQFSATFAYSGFYGLLVGFYTLASSGVFNLNKKVVLESAWLTQSDDNTILNIALKNVDLAANTPKNFKVAVYE